ncbi:MAG TPA: GNAT family N-acetyltransferase [Flavobacteriaceae bacterium]|nr:GNAT family N-acetyltransferase [Flavobacteriaceae bacterium]MCB9214142.1 GNAT family N-acetyltransferase [Alteromonas sp.]HPF11955.1 GNAT family N-acetyltransferase [Flavobacteriaceae bacterium]HQU22058.1 GNAT family N-acetyltransferase [Flavobacteriaceae bacterium]HQU65413.1 GNAT family N-acetyltransferase [Flavobacteriaceae bacterium]
MRLKGKYIFLRALEPEDLEFLYLLENDESVWEISNTVTPYSKFVLKQYLENAHRDIYEVKQLRLVICSNVNDKVLGFVDLFEFDPKHRRAGLGVIIFSEQDRGKGYAYETVQLMCAYGFDHLNLHQIFANIASDNKKSLKLFEKLGFQKVGKKKDWILSGGRYKSEWLYQLIHE